MAEQPWRDHIIRTPNGIYIPQSVADVLRPAYRAPDTWSGAVGDFLGTPVYILPPLALQPRPHWWIRAWRKLTGRRRPR